MTRNKIFSVIVLVCLLAAIPLNAALAADYQVVSVDTSPGDGTVLVTVIDPATGLAQKISLSWQEAITFGLVVPSAFAGPYSVTPITLYQGSADLVGVTGVVTLVAVTPDNLPVPPTYTITVTLDGVTLVTLPLPDATDPRNDALVFPLITLAPANPLPASIPLDPASINVVTQYTKHETNLANFFGPSLGLTYDDLASYVAMGFGYGEIAQASWMASQLDGDADMVSAILNAKSSGDYSSLTTDYGITATNWGQLRKEVLTDPHQNLGSITSGKAVPPEPTTADTTGTTSQGNSNANANNNANSNSSANANNNANANSSDNNGNGNDKIKENNGNNDKK